MPKYLTVINSMTQSFNLDAKVSFRESVGHEVRTNDVTPFRYRQFTVEPFDVLK
jgi:hypothetical protein